MTMDQNFKQAEKAAEKAAQQFEKELISAYRTSLKEVRAQIALAYEKYAVNGTLSMTEMQKYGRLVKLEEAIAKEVSKLTGTETRTTKKAIKAVFLESYYRSGWVLETGCETNLGFAILKPEAVEASILNPLDRIGWPERIKEHARLMNRQIQEEITRGIIQGKSYDQIARAVKERLDVGASKALRIVQTETHRAQSQGTQAAYEKAAASGLIFKRVWMATLDGRTRDRHRSLDGQKVEGIDTPFKMAGMQAMYPGGFGSPDMDINCRCTVRAEIEGMEPDLRRSRDPKTGKNVVVPNMTYKEWYSKNVKGFERKDIIKNIIVPNEAKNIKGFSQDIVDEIDFTINTIEKEYELHLDEIVVKALAEQNVPFQFQTESSSGIGRMLLVINKNYNFNGNLKSFNERILDQYNTGYLASKNVKNLIEHEIAHILTFQGVSPARWQLFSSELNEEFIRGISGYADNTRDTSECIAEAFVRKRNGEEISKSAEYLLKDYIEKWRK